MMTSVSSSILPDVLSLIPGYDPAANAGDYHFDEAAAARALEFFPACLTHTKGVLAGKPLELEPWEQAIVANLLGWKDDHGLRRYRECLTLVPRKNGKTTLAAGFVLFMLFCDHEPGAEIYCAAADREQALLVFNQAEVMVRNDPEMEQRAKIYTAAKTIVYRAENSSFKAISAEANTKYGYNTSLAIIDELHAQKDRDLVDVLRTSTGARAQPLVMHITTADFDRESICNEIYDYACKVRDGVIIDPAFLPVIHEADREDDWTDEAVWEKANPNLDVSVSREYLRRECQRAQESPAFENTFKRLHLNIRTEQDVRWLALGAWDACDRVVADEELRGLPCWAGLDLSSKTDVAALVLVFRMDAEYAVRLHCWLPSESAHERERRDGVPYITWARQGLIELTDGNVIDYGKVTAGTLDRCQRWGCKEIAVDRWQSEHMMQLLAGEGLEVVPFGQGFASMSDPTKELERLVLGKAIHHGGNPVLRWMASNVSVEIDAAENMKPSKKKSTERIDGIVATIMALGRAMVHQQPAGSVYDKRGLLII